MARRQAAANRKRHPEAGSNIARRKTLCYRLSRLPRLRKPTRNLPQSKLDWGSWGPTTCCGLDKGTIPRYHQHLIWAKMPKIALALTARTNKYLQFLHHGWTSAQKSHTGATMSKAKLQLLMLGVSLLGLGVAWASYRNCNRGCQTFADHLVEHGLQDIIAALI